MSKKADCWDNAVSESFFKTLKTEWLYHVDLIDLDHAERELFEYIEMFYNNHDGHTDRRYERSVGSATSKARSLVHLLPDHISFRRDTEQHLPAAMIEHGAHRLGRLAARSRCALELERL